MRGRRKAWVVADLGFGDSGKGTITDYLVRTRGATLVVRFNGGAQAGHNVVTDDGRHHCFAQLGAGSFVPEVRTHLSENVVLHPSALLVELEHLERKGVRDLRERLTVAAGALVTTPFHQAAGRARELARGSDRHGTCGVGVGETVRDAIEDPDGAIRARDLESPSLKGALERTRRRLLDSLGSVPALEGANEELEILRSDQVSDRWLDMISGLDWSQLVVPDEHLALLLQQHDVVLEGAQGALLDQDYGFHPHTTWSDCRAAAATALLGKHAFDGDTTKVGVIRTYLTRHGQGPFPTETSELDVLAEPHNTSAGWQGAFRRGFLDVVLLRYALATSGGIDELALTHVDRLSARREWLLAIAYESLGALPVATEPDLNHQQQLTTLLNRATPIYDKIPAEQIPEALERELDTPISLLSRGPTAADKAPR